MNTRLDKFLQAEQLTPAKFADIIGVQRSSISHIISGRNNPSFDFIQKVLTRFPRLNSEWLILGKGEMYKQMVQATLFDAPVVKPDLFTESEVSTSVNTSEGQDSTDTLENIKTSELQSDAKALLNDFKGIDNVKITRDIEQIVIFYRDGTFKYYSPTTD